MRKTLTVIALTAIFVLGSGLMAQYTAADGFSVSWTLDPTGNPDIEDHDGYGARSVLAGMDFDRDGHREILFTMDETLAPGGPDPGDVEVYLYENTGDDTYEYVWHFTTPDPGNSLPGLTYGDIDEDGLYEIYFGVPPAVGSNDDTWGTYIFEQDAQGVFPSTQTVLLQYGYTSADNFRPAGFVVEDVDNDGDIELVTVDRGTRKMTVHSLEAGTLDEFASFTQEFIDTDHLGGGGIYDVDVVDFDGDGMKEIWVNTWDMFSFAIFEVDSADSYSFVTEFDQLVGVNDPGSFNSHDLLIQDIDGDGKMEGLFPMTDGVLYFLDNVDSSLTELVADDFVRVGAFGSRSRGAAWGDVDDDGNLDIIVGQGSDEIVSRIEYIFGDPADSSSYEWTEIFDISGDNLGDRFYPPSVAPADMDGDGNKEIFLTNLYATEAGQPAIFVLEFDPASASNYAEGWSMLAAFNHHSAVDTNFYQDISGTPRSVIAGMDMDMDGAHEVIATDYTGNKVHVFEYDAINMVFEEVWSSPFDTASHYWANPRTVGVGDLDGDGNQEIVFPRATTNLEGWWIFEWDGVVGSDNYGDTYSSINMVEIDTCCAGDGSAFRGDHERTTIYDIDGDGKEELISSIRRGSNRGTLIMSVEGDIEHNAGGNGFETWQSEFFVDRGDYGGGSPYHSLPADLDGDGNMELVNHTWNYYNFFNITSTGPDSYAMADVSSPTRYYQATYPYDHVSLFGGAAGDVDGDGNDEAYFTNYYTRDLYVVDYESGDDVLEIDGTHVVKIAENVGNFYSSVFDVEGDGNMNIFTGHRHGTAVVSTDFIGTDPRSPSSYASRVIYAGENDRFFDITVVDSGGVVTTTRSYDVPGDSWFSSKIESNFNGDPIDFDNDGNNELVVSFQGMGDSLVTNTYTWNGSSWDTTRTAIFNERDWAFIVLENEATGTDVDPIRFITPNDYVLNQNYPNPFNPTTTIEYALPINKNISIKVYNMMGQLVTTLVDNEYQKAGTHRVMWNGLNSNNVKVASGAYIYSLEWGNFRKTQKMLLLK